MAVDDEGRARRQNFKDTVIHHAGLLLVLLRHPQHDAFAIVELIDLLRRGETGSPFKVRILKERSDHYPDLFHILVALGSAIADSLAKEPQRLKMFAHGKRQIQSLDARSLS